MPALQARFNAEIDMQAVLLVFCTGIEIVKINMQHLHHSWWCPILRIMMPVSCTVTVTLKIHMQGWHQSWCGSMLRMKCKPSCLCSLLVS